jgi:transketolase
MAAHGGVRPFGATFFVFTDYLRPALRMAALMELPVIYVMTHDSIGLGEDGPTHQPIEHLASLRAMPNVLVLRPGDANETVEAWRLAIENRHGPTVLVLTRQKVPVLDRAAHGPASGLRRGGYIVAEAAGATPRAILIATGSELGLALEAWGRLAAAGVPVRVVSLPSWEQFEAQQQEYRDEVLPPAVRARLVIEAGASQGWLRYVTEDGDMMTIDRFGASAPADVLFREFGLTVEEAVRRVHRLLHGRTS